MNDSAFLIFTIILGLLGTGFACFYAYKLLQTPEMGSKGRRFNIVFLIIAGLILVTGLVLAFAGSGRIADWGTFLATGIVAVTLLWLAAQGFGVGFRQMEKDGIGFLRLFQLGSSIILCLAIVPAFYAFVTFATKIR